MDMHSVPVRCVSQQISLYDPRLVGSNSSTRGIAQEETTLDFLIILVRLLGDTPPSDIACEPDAVVDVHQDRDVVKQQPGRA